MRQRTDVGQLGQLVHGLLVLVGQLEGGKVVMVLAHVVRLHDGAEHGEPVLDIERLVVAVVVDACALADQGLLAAAWRGI